MARSRLVLAALAAGLLAPGAHAERLPLFVIPTAVRGDAAVEPRLPLRVALHVPDPRAYAALLGLPDVAVREDRVEFALRGDAQLPPSDPASFLAASFVVDHAEPAVAALHAELVHRHGATPSRAALVEFARGAVEHDELGRSWDVASRVASTRTGDCTEHAVLLAALARSVGRPARVVVGAALVTEGGRFTALGHAWTELFEAERWHVADAALAPDARPLAYLPFGVLDDEGPGYNLALARFSSSTWITRVEILANEPQ